MIKKPTQAEIEEFRRAVEQIPKHTNSALHRQDVEALAWQPQQSLAEIDEVSADQVLSYCDKHLPREVFRQLRQGLLPIDARLDLHQFTLESATERLLERLAYHQQAQHQCLLIIHGKGQHSKTGVPLLKRWLNHWLRKHPGVVAFHSAVQKDGGTGAMYVLL